ncbi:MAG: hypothetical protein WCX28_05835 [Bacteriovoracaceae bacterium]|nr:hypothetical protein [Bacteroidota bacterium]
MPAYACLPARQAGILVPNSGIHWNDAARRVEFNPNEIKEKTVGPAGLEPATR